MLVAFLASSLQSTLTFYVKLFKFIIILHRLGGLLLLLASIWLLVCHQAQSRPIETNLLLAYALICSRSNFVFKQAYVCLCC